MLVKTWMLVKITQNTTYIDQGGVTHGPGAEAHVEQQEGEALIRTGSAVLVTVTEEKEG